MFSFMNPGKSKPAKKGLKIIIVGCGKVGTTLVEQLSKEGHDIIIIDKNAKKVQEIANMYDIMGIVGNGASYSVQMDAGIEETDLIISVIKIFFASTAAGAIWCVFDIIAGKFRDSGEDTKEK